MKIMANNSEDVFGISINYLINLSENDLTDLINKLDSNEIDRFMLLKPLILETESMDNEEKQYWFDILPSMTKKHIETILTILVGESKKLENLELKYANEIKALNEKHKKEWNQYQKDNPESK